MEKLRKLAGLTGLILLMALALMGVGIGLPLLPRREKFLDNEVKIELFESIDRQEKLKE